MDINPTVINTNGSRQRIAQVLCRVRRCERQYRVFKDLYRQIKGLMEELL
jgi:hypothetical protein